MNKTATIPSYQWILLNIGLCLLTLIELVVFLWSLWLTPFELQLMIWSLLVSAGFIQDYYGFGIINPTNNLFRRFSERIKELEE